MQKILGPEEVRGTCHPELLKKIAQFRNLEKKVIIGQGRALKALKLGLGMKAHGFNIYVSGQSGTGKLTAITSFLEGLAKNEPTPPDWCYVNNFKDSYRPQKLSLPAGTGMRLKKDMKSLVDDIRNALVKAFESEEYADRKGKIVSSFEDVQAKVLGKIQEEAERDSFMVKQTPTSIITIPVKDNKPLTDADLKGMSEAEINEINKKQAKLQEDLGAGIREIRKFEKETAEKLDKLAKEVAQYAIGNLIDEMIEKYKAIAEVIKYLQGMRDDIMDNLAEFMKAQNPNAAMPMQQGENPFHKRYEVTVLVDNSETKGAPVIIERNPNYNNLLGRVEKESFMGMLVTDFTMIRKGSLHTANGGYLILRIEELLQNYFSWNGLKRALKNREIVIEEAADQLGYLTTRSLKPEPIPLNVKIILIGNQQIYHLLYQYDFEFRELFKVIADFDSTMERSEENTGDYIAFIESMGKREGLLEVDDTGIARVIEYGSRMAQDQHKLSTRFGSIADVLREANYYASEEKGAAISGAHVARAIEERMYRSNLIQEKINEMITTRQIFIDITGSKVGQINGLSVISIGDIAFGMPTRITCSVNLGKGEVIAIEREAELSGPIHTKGVLILTGYLAGKFMQDKPLSLSARLVFEQSYSEVEGDSASSTELYAILSALSGVPIKQGIAVTGSVNQKGDVQPIGGINEKVEGYFEICKRMGLNGEQGVMVPSANIRNMMLKEEVTEAVRQGKFKIWAVDTIDDGIEVLTGMKAGSLEEPGTIFNLVNNVLVSYADKMKSFAFPDGVGKVIKVKKEEKATDKKPGDK
jgi:lon-related putative ATP-dependent protease